MTPDDFRRIALSFEGAEEGSHMGNPDFRVGGHIFATLASAKQGYGNLKLTVEQQSAFIEELPKIFLPVHGGWGRGGMTHIRLADAPEDVLAGALQAAWKLRADRNTISQSKGHAKNVSRSTRSGGRARAGKTPSRTKSSGRTSRGRSGSDG